jgi:hypothetical protein
VLVLTGFRCMNYELSSSKWLSVDAWQEATAHLFAQKAFYTKRTPKLD